MADWRWYLDCCSGKWLECRSLY